MRGQAAARSRRPRDEEWWVKAKLRREQVSYLPPALAVRKELEDALEQIAAATSEVTVRRIVAEINERIVHVNSHTITGPPSTLMPLNAERVVERWTVAQSEHRGPRIALGPRKRTYRSSGRESSRMLRRFPPRSPFGTDPAQMGERLFGGPHTVIYARPGGVAGRLDHGPTGRRRRSGGRRPTS